MSTLSTANIQTKAANTPPVIKDVNGTECGTFCRAWVNFQGTGTVAINDSFNVSAVTDVAQGAYTVTLSNAMPNTNYAVTAFLQYDSSQTASTAGSAQGLELARVAKTTTSFGLISRIYTGTLYDAESIFAVVFGG